MGIATFMYADDNNDQLPSPWYNASNDDANKNAKPHGKIFKTLNQSRQRDDEQ
jgi:hypothetical protein